jgi:hypothetical protein
MKIAHLVSNLLGKLHEFETPPAIILVNFPVLLLAVSRAVPDLLAVIATLSGIVSALDEPAVSNISVWHVNR